MKSRRTKTYKQSTPWWPLPRNRGGRRRKLVPSEVIPKRKRGPLPKQPGAGRPLKRPAEFEEDRRHWLIVELEALRLDQRLTITEHAARAGLPKNTMVEWFRGGRWLRTLHLVDKAFRAVGYALAIRKLDALDEQEDDI